MADNSSISSLISNSQDQSQSDARSIRNEIRNNHKKSDDNSRSFNPTGGPVVGPQEVSNFLFEKSSVNEEQDEEQDLSQDHSQQEDQQTEAVPQVKSSTPAAELAEAFLPVFQKLLEVSHTSTTGTFARNVYQADVELHAPSLSGSSAELWTAFAGPFHVYNVQRNGMKPLWDCMQRGAQLGYVNQLPPTIPPLLYNDLRYDNVWLVKQIDKLHNVDMDGKLKTSLAALSMPKEITTYNKVAVNK